MPRQRHSHLAFFAVLLFTTALVTALEADIYQWEWIDPGDPSQGKQPSTTVCRSGNGCTPEPGMDVYRRYLSRAYLIGFDLTGANFTKSTLWDADFSGANLSDTNFQDATLTHANLTGATITGANFDSTTDKGFTQSQFESTASYTTGDLSGVYLSNNDLRGWNFAGKNLTGVSFFRSKLSKADFSGAIIAGAGFSYDPGFTRAIFESTASYATGELTGIALSGKHLRGWNFAGKNLTDASFLISKLANADFSGANLTGSDFDYAKLNGADFSGANITGSSFQLADVSGANFNSVIGLSEATLGWSSFVGADLGNNDLTGWNLRDAYLSGVNFSGCLIGDASFRSTVKRGFTQEQFESTTSYATGDLTKIDLRENDLTGWNFAGKNLTEVEFGSSMLKNADFSGATITKVGLGAVTDGGFTRAQFESTVNYATDDLSYVTLGANDLTGWNFAGKNLTHTDFRYSTLKDADLTDANLTNTNFFDATLTGADFSGSDLADADCRYAALAGADFSGANLSGVDFSWNTLAGAVFAGANLRYVNCREATLTDLDLTGVNLTRARLPEADLTDANLSGANLTLANCRKAHLIRANLTDANLANVNFLTATLSSADTRGAKDLSCDTAFSTENLIQPDGRVDGLSFTWKFRVWDYAGLDTDDDGSPDTPLGITVGDEFSMLSISTLTVGLEDDDWGSTIGFDAGIDVSIDGTLEIELRDGFVPSPGDEWQLFDFSGVMPAGGFHTYTLPEVAECVWDTSRLMDDGVLSITAVPEPSAVMLIVIGTLASLLLRRIVHG